MLSRSPAQKLRDKTFAEGCDTMQFAYFSPVKVSGDRVNTAVGKLNLPARFAFLLMC